MRVVVTGGAGNLGTKLRLALEKADWVSEIVGIDVHPFEASGKSRSVVADLADPHDARWLEACARRRRHRPLRLRQSALTSSLRKSRPRRST